ncbi:MAG: Bax inhibitor-1 family protein [Woeseiaceae bacterium]
MQDQTNYLAPAAEASVEDRSRFIWRTYAHVTGAIFAFVGVVAYIIQAGMVEGLLRVMVNSPFIMLIGFVGGSWAARWVAHSAKSSAVQYAAMAALIVLYGAVFAPTIAIANAYQPGVVDSAAGITLLGSVGLIVTAMLTRKDFSFLRGIAVWGSWIALTAIAASIFMGFELGQWFAIAMIALLGITILWQTSNILHHYPTNMHVAASLELFSSIVILFMWILRFMSRE